MRCLVVNDTDTTMPNEFLSEWVAKLGDQLAGRNILSSERVAKELSLVFLKEPEAKRLNWQYRGKDYATDVLSFTSDDPESIGELVFCDVVLRKQATEKNHSFEREVGYLVVHGVLHLMGFDHEDIKTPPAESERMFKLQEEIFGVLIQDFFPKKKNSPKRASRTKKSGSNTKTQGVYTKGKLQSKKLDPTSKRSVPKGRPGSKSLVARSGSKRNSESSRKSLRGAEM